MNYYLYSNTQERFIAKIPDIWIGMTIAKLMSSKMSLTFCSVSSSDMSNDNCIDWGLVDTSEAKQDYQVPVLVKVKKGLTYKGPVTDIPLEIFQNYQRIILGVYEILRAAWLTDAILNSSNQKFFEKLFDYKSDLVTVYDDSGVDGGFLNSIEKVIYFSNSLEEMDNKINSLFENPHSSRPSNLQIYKNTFKGLKNEY